MCVGVLRMCVSERENFFLYLPNYLRYNTFTGPKFPKLFDDLADIYKFSDTFAVSSSGVEET
jgi:hypothetical protein